MLALLVAELCFHAWLIPRVTYDPDEFFTVGSAWRISQGKLPFLDILDVHPPFLFKLYSVPLAWLGERADIVDLFRGFHGGLTLLLCWLMFAFYRRAFDAKTALWALCLQNSLPFFVRTTIHVRPDEPALLFMLAAALVLAGPKDRPLTRSGVALAAVFSGLAAATHITIPFLVVGAVAWLFLVRAQDAGWLAGLKTCSFFGAVAIATFLATYFLVFGVKAPAAWIANAELFSFVRVYLDEMPNQAWLTFRNLLAENPLTWALLGAGLAHFHVRWVIARRARLQEALPLLLTDGGLLFVLFHDQIFAQHYLLVTVFAAGIAAAAIRDGTAAVARRLRAHSAPVAELAMILVFAATTVNAGRADLAASRERDAVPPPELVAAGATRDGKMAWVDPETARHCLKKAPGLQQPFAYRAQPQRAAQLQFLLENSRPDDIVYSDWLNPPYRELPVAVNHGLMITLYENSKALRQSPRLAALLRRFDPDYSPAESAADQVMIRLFAAKRPALITLDGRMAQLFCDSRDFRDWLSARYRLTFHPESGSFFALRNREWN